VLIGNNGNSACGAIKKNFDLFLVGGTFWSLILAYLNNFFSLSLSLLMLLCRLKGWTRCSALVISLFTTFHSPLVCVF
jgi:hypothetical protein